VEVQEPEPLLVRFGEGAERLYDIRRAAVTGHQAWIPLFRDVLVDRDDGGHQPILPGAGGPGKAAG
jgi:hypothetical protein